ncbi:DUF2147 domain-containing protein [Hyphomicrobium sp.]|uniref:DUF2147 domain-containing protein n=1 Tax=Hyphomicrobium sp. TaxID=82 RepID=UPI002C7591B3|nr:DUF2147 domain-containing protein [Hyphomicrobium sp.]HVZ05229.1 DUF2147 domain-containing protein [Hyphomicrobium sp.]
MRGMKVVASAFAVFSLAPAAFESASAASDPTGIWINDTGRGAIEIRPCGDKLCGNVVWVKNAEDAKGCGKQIIGDVASVGGGHWDNGWIYSPERGRKYNVELTPLDNGKLRVTGYAGLKFLSKTMIWTRAPENLQLCGQTEAQATPPATATQPSTNSGTNAKPAAKPEVAMASPPSSAKPAAIGSHGVSTSPSTGSANPETGTADASKAPADQPPTASKDAKPSTNSSEDETASADDTASDLQKKLDDLGLGKVFTKTRSGKCKLDLPWVKVTIDCGQ